jgi:hypothetical protein
MCGVRRHDLPDHEPVKEHPKAREMLLDGRRGQFALKVFDVGGDMDRLDAGKAEVPRFAPVEKHGGGTAISRPCVAVADIDREELGVWGATEQKRHLL